MKDKKTCTSFPYYTSSSDLSNFYMFLFPAFAIIIFTTALQNVILKYDAFSIYYVIIIVTKQERRNEKIFQSLTLHPQLLDLAVDLRGLEGDAENRQCEDSHEEHLSGMPLQEVAQLAKLILQSRPNPHH